MNTVEKAILQQSQRHMSFYIYDENKITESVTALRNDFPRVQFLYSVKTNPFPPVVKCVVENGLGIDAASLNEVLMGEREGLSKERIYYSAPGKTPYDIISSIEKSIIIADSLNELALIENAAREIGKRVKIGVRINPDFTFDSDKGSAGKFGIDAAILFENKNLIKAYSHLEIAGIHVHSRSQELNAAVLEKYYDNMMRLAVKVQEEFEIKLDFVNMGGGLGIPYSEQDLSLDTKALGEKTAQLMERFRESLPDIKIFIETGRFAVGKSGFYATKAVDKKISCGKNFVILNSTLNGFIRPSLAMMVESYCKDEHPFASEPLYTEKDAFQFKVLTDETETETVTLCGSLCTGTDVIAKDIVLPKINIGDVIYITNAGSYAAVLSPFQFASLPTPSQIFLTKDGLAK